MSKYDFSDLGIPFAEPPAGKLPAQLRALLTRAEQGDPDAQYALGTALIQQGTAWLMRAAAQNQKDAADMMSKRAPVKAADAPQKSMPSTPTPKAKPKALPMLIQGSLKSIYPDLLKSTTYTYISAIEFHDTLNNAPENARDFSHHRDRSVLGWLTSGSSTGQRVLHIAGEGGVSAPYSCRSSFEYFSGVDRIAFNNCFDTSHVLDMSRMFYGCSGLTGLDLSTFDTKQVRTMKEMFQGCESLAQLDLSSFDTGNVTDMSSMFFACQKLTQLDLSAFDTKNVTDMQHMFHGCRGLSSLDLSAFDTEKVADMKFMFYQCSQLILLDISGFRLSANSDILNIFNECSSLLNGNELYTFLERQKNH